MDTVKVKPWGQGQGEFVIINASDLTDTHELFETASEAETEGAEAPRRGRPRKVQE